MSGDQLNALAFEVAFDVVCSFSRFNDDFSTNMRQLQYDLDNHFKGRKDIEVIHTGSSYEQLFLAHVSAKKLNTDGDHMIIQTNYIVQESGTPSKTVHTRRSEVSIDTDIIPTPPDTFPTSSIDTYQPSNIDGENSAGSYNIKKLYMHMGSHPGYVLLSNMVSKDEVDVENCLNNKEFIENAAKNLKKIKSVNFPLYGRKLIGPSHNSSWMVSTFNIEQDFVYSLKCSQWSRQADEWISRPREFRWPSDKTLKEIVEYGCHIVPVSSHGCSEADKDVEWRLSFSWAELMLVKSIPEKVKLAYSILKVLIKMKMKEEDAIVFTSYHLKTTLFWFLEGSGVDRLQELTISDIVRTLLERLVSFYASSNIPNYFVRCNNMIDHQSSEDILRVVRVLENMRGRLTTLLCQYIDTYHHPPISFGSATFLQQFEKDIHQFYRSSKYSLLLLSQANYLLTLKEESMSNKTDMKKREWSWLYLNKAVSLHKSSLSNSKEVILDSSDVTSTMDFIGVLGAFISDDKLNERDCSSVMFAVFNVFLTTLPCTLDESFRKDSNYKQKVRFYLSNPAFKDIFLWLMQFNDEKSAAVYQAVMQQWNARPCFHAPDEVSLKFSRLMLVSLAQPTRQSRLIRGTLIRNTCEKDIGLLMIPLYEYLLCNELQTCAFVALQVRSYYSGKKLLWWFTYNIQNHPFPEIKRGLVEIMLRENVLRKELSEEEIDDYKMFLVKLNATL